MDNYAAGHQKIMDKAYTIRYAKTVTHVKKETEQVSLFLLLLCSCRGGRQTLRIVEHSAKLVFGNA